MGKKLLAEGFGTFWLVLGGCGSAAIAANFPYLTGADIAPGNPFGLGFLGVSLAFGLTVVTLAYAIGHISGCHLNPAVSFGLWASGRMKGSELLPYIVAQVIAGVAVVEHRGVVAGGLDCSNQLIGAHQRVMVDVSLFDCEVHRGRHPVEAIEATFDPGRAG